MNAFESVNKAANSVNETARDVWLAGLGAFVRAQEEGNKVFDGLVKEGEKFETKTRKDVNKRVEGIRGRVEGQVKSVQKTATGNWNKLEKVFEDRVARVLARLGVPTSDDIKKLSNRVEKLSKEVKALNATK